MRTAFIEELVRLASADERIWLLTGDLGFSVLERFEREFPQRFLNAGVAEQNMTGMAAGLALDNRIVFTYSISNFPTLRCLEQIRNDVCYHNLNVKIISVGAGVAYGTHGYTHHGVEDIGIMRCLPNMAVISPADPFEARRAAQLATQIPGPMYIRLGKNNEPQLHGCQTSFNLGEAIVLQHGVDATLIATGSIAYEAYRAMEQLRAEGYDVGFISCPCVKPLDNKALIEAGQTTSWIITVEEHGPSGGLGSAVAEFMAAHDLRARLHSMSLPPLVKDIGSQAWLLQRLGLNADGIKTTACKLLSTLSSR